MGIGNSQSDRFVKLRRVDHLLTLGEYVGKSTRTLEEELSDVWFLQSIIVELHSSYHKLDKAFGDDDGWIWNDLEKEHLWRYFSVYSRYKSDYQNDVVLTGVVFDGWLREIKETGLFIPYFAYPSSEDFIRHCKYVAEKALNTPIKETGIELEEAVCLTAVIDPIGNMALEHFLRNSTKPFSFGTMLTTAYTGLVKLARHTKLAERTYIWEGLYSDGLFGKPASEVVLKKDEQGFFGAISRTFIQTTKDLDQVLKFKNEWDENPIVFEIEEREEDEGGLHNGVLIPPLFMEPYKKHCKESDSDCEGGSVGSFHSVSSVSSVGSFGSINGGSCECLDGGIDNNSHSALLRDDLRLYPPLTLFQIKDTRLVTYAVDALSPRVKQLFPNRKTIDITFVVLDPLFSPTPHLPQLLPTRSVWDAVRLGNVEVVHGWVHSHPSVNLEAIHEEYQCSLLYSAARGGHLEVVRELVNSCAHVNAQSPKHGSTPLHAACFFGYVDIVEFLLLSGADPEIKNKEGLMPVQEVPTNRNRNVILNHLSSWKRPLSYATPGKMVGSFLVYGHRLHYLKGFDLLGSPVLTLQQEFSREQTLYEKSSGYHKTRDIWNSAVSSLAHLKTLTPAKMLIDEEILALRIYTGPFYVVVNQFLRQLFTADKINKQKHLLSRENTWVSMVLHLNSAIHKLSQMNTGGINTTNTVSYRGLDKPLRPDFFIPDHRGMIAATEFGFMSTSTSKQCAMEFTSKLNATLFCVKPRCSDASGLHAGAEMSWCSEFPKESEILFPPLTLFEVIKRKRKNSLVKVTVAPKFV